MLRDSLANSEPETGEETLAPKSQGYAITLQILPDGTFMVDGEPAPDIKTAIKHILAIIEEHPVSENAQEQFTAGYQAS